MLDRVAVAHPTLLPVTAAAVFFLLILLLVWRRGHRLERQS
jgi:hypothetical protein